MSPSSAFYRWMIAVCVIFVLTTSHLAAQRFQYAYGGANTDGGRSGVKQLSNGDYIAVASTYSSSSGNSDVYVVRTRNDGSRSWEFTYDIGDNDFPADIIEITGGGFVICGTTYGAGGTCGTLGSAFLLKIDANGGSAVAQTYGLLLSGEGGWSVVEAQFGDNVITHAGDFIVAGHTDNQAGTGRDGFIFRTGSNLGLLWDMQYGGTGSSDEYFFDVIEAKAAGAGEIVAVGFTNTWGASANDIFVVRVNPNSGLIDASSPTQGAAAWGWKGDDEGRALIEIQNGTDQGDIVITGHAYSRVLGSTVPEIILLQLEPNPCNLVAARYAWNNIGSGGALGLDLKEDPHSVGDIIVTGGIRTAVNGYDAFLHRFDIGTLVPAAAGSTYGGNGHDEGASVNSAQTVPGATTSGYIVCGVTQSSTLIGADPEDLYLIKTDVNFSSNCNEASLTLQSATASLSSACITPEMDLLHCNECSFNPVPDDQHWGLKLCYIFPKPVQGNESDLTFSESSLTSYPNPVASGSPLDIRFDLKAGASAHISISDVAGTIIHRSDANIPAGSYTHQVATNGWPAGLYLARVEIGGRQMTTRIVVLDR